eukprot:5722402-Pleurochrysis_carterae.AAC.2
MSWLLAIAVTDGKGVGFAREGHRQADVVDSLACGEAPVGRHVVRPCRRQDQTHQAERQRVHAPAQAGQTGSWRRACYPCAHAVLRRNARGGET